MTNTQVTKISILFVLGLAMLGCDDSSTDMPPTLDNIQVEIFDVACATSGCHDAATQAGALDLSTAQASYEALVMAPVSNEVASENGWVRVKPYDPDLSFLIRKIEQPGVGEGAAMPVGRYELTDFYVTLISEWIESGAEL